jgi:pimeloyl-ACP methyl ester carboxylesterase
MNHYLYRVFRAAVVFAAAAILPGASAGGLLPVSLNLSLGDLLNPGPPIAPVVSPPAPVVTHAVSFTVHNLNRSRVPCLSDGATYTIRGHLVMPATHPAPSSVTLYLHGLGFGESFWRFQNPAGYDFTADMASRGHASVVIDRLGYDSSPHPLGFNVCLGSQADMAHQIIQQLRSGAYQIDAGAVSTFSRVALAGHSIGGSTSQIEAYSFGDIDALAVISYADLGASPETLLALSSASLICATGGRQPEPGSPAGYAPFGVSDADFQALMFHHADPAVDSAVTAQRNLDPCGDLLAAAPALAGNVANLALLGIIHVPVLVMCGNNDAVFPPPACTLQRGLYLGSPDTTLNLLDDTGHAVTVELNAPVFRQRLSDWLAARGF